MTYRSRMVFIENQGRTEFFRRVAERLDRDTVRISWITVSAAHRDRLLQEYPAEDVLYLPMSLPEPAEPQPVKINDLLFCDRRLKYIMPRGKRYLQAIQPKLLAFLDDPLPTLVEGELTYSYEIVAYRLIKDMLPHCRWVSLFHTRVPPNHFAFFEDEAFSREVWPVPEQRQDESTLPQGEANKLSYADLNRNISAHFSSRRFMLEKMKRFFSNAGFDADDPTYNSHGRWDKLRKNIPFFANKLSYGWVPKAGMADIEACKGRSVIFPLHLQPESNIDTCGRYWDNQAETILKIWRQLGPDDVLFIKEHPVALGNRGFGWYRRLLSYPNIRLLHHRTPPQEIIRKIDYVFTVAGTMGMEAALNGGKVLCLAPTSYDRLENVVSPRLEDFRRCGTIDDLYDTLRTEKTNGWDKDTYTRHVVSYAYPGDGAGDLNANPHSWSPRNLTLVAQALSSVLNRLQSDA